MNLNEKLKARAQARLLSVSLISLGNPEDRMRVDLFYTLTIIIILQLMLHNRHPRITYSQGSNSFFNSIIECIMM